MCLENTNHTATSISWFLWPAKDVFSLQARQCRLSFISSLVILTICVFRMSHYVWIAFYFCIFFLCFCSTPLTFTPSMQRRSFWFGVGGSIGMGSHHWEPIGVKSIWMNQWKEDTMEWLLIIPYHINHKNLISLLSFYDFLFSNRAQ